MAYPVYSEYKKHCSDIGSRIPLKWDSIPLRWFVNVGSGDYLSNHYMEMDHDRVNHVPVIGGNGLMAFTKKPNTPEWSLVVGRVGAHCGNVHLIDEDSWVTDNALRIKFDATELYPKYLYWALLDLKLNDYANKNAQPLITGDTIKSKRIPYPVLSEQKSISQFLDHKTQQIDQLIAKKQTLITKLNEQRIALITHAVTKGLNPNVEMKDSGVGWLGEVPEHWDTVRLRYITEKITSGSRGWAQYFSDDGEQFLRITNLSRKSITLLEGKMRYVNPPEGTEGERTKTQEGDILISITADLGSIAVIPEDYKASYVSQHIALVRLEPEQFNSRWIAYCLFSHTGKAQLLGAGYGGTKVQLSLVDIKEVYVPIPPLSEQTKIIKRIDKEITHIDKMIKLNQKTITKLKEYRTALITAAVTGKIDVRNWQLPEEQAA